MKHHWSGILTLAATLICAGWSGASAWGQDVARVAPVEPPHLPDQPPAVAGEAADAAADADADANVAEPEGEKPSFTFRANSIQLSHHMQFNEAGGVEHESSSFSLGINVSYDSDITAVAYRDFSIDRIVTDTGEQLKTSHQPAVAANINQQHHGNQRQPRFSLSMNLVPPTRNARAIAEISGQMKVIYSSGDLRQAVLEPFKEIDGKRAKIVEVPGSVLARREEHGVRVEFRGDAMAMLDQVRFFTADGAEIPSRGWGSGSSNQMTYRSYRLEMPDDARVVLTFFAETKTVDVPFTIRDVPMPGAMTQEFDIVIEAPIVGAEQANAGPPANEDGAQVRRVQPMGLVRHRALRVVVEGRGEENNAVEAVGEAVEE